MEAFERGLAERKSRSSSEMSCLSPASTSYGDESPSLRDDICTPTISDHRPDRERKWKADKQQRRRTSASPGHWISSEKAEAHDCGLSSTHGNSMLEAKSKSQKQARKKHKGRHSSLKVCLNEKFRGALPLEKEGPSDDNLDDMSNSRTFERLVQRSELEEEVLVLHKRLEEELELRVILESAMEHASGALTSVPRHLPIFAQELLADITVLEVAVLKLEEQSSTLRSQLGQARIEREIAELKQSSGYTLNLRREGSLLHPTFPDSIDFSEEIQPAPSPSKTPWTAKQPEKAVSHLTLASDEQFTHSQESLQSCWYGQESQPQPPRKFWKEQWSLDQLRQDLRLTIPDIFESDHLSPTLWNSHHDFGHGPEKLTRSTRSPWQHNPLEEEEHWIPLHEHHPQAMLQDQNSASGRLVDNCLLSVGLVAHEDDPPCFSPAIISETLLPNSSPKFTDARSLVPFTETEKPLLENNVLQPEEHMKELPILALPSIQPESWSFTSEDDHPRPESGSVLNSFRGNEQHCSQQADVPSIDEQRIKYHIGVLKTREQRSQGCRDKHLDRLKPIGLAGRSSSWVTSDAPLSSIRSPVHPRLRRDGWESPERTDSDEGYKSSELPETPNELSEEMVRCMVSIYCHLAEPSNIVKGSSPSGNTQSPTSPFGALTNSSASSLSESSLLSVTRSPLVDLRSKEDVLGNENSSDPFKAKGKIPWADIGPYGNAFEVPWLSVGKDELEYAAQALRNFKLLVEQLSRVDPSKLSHDQKLAFWINLYNTLLMHAYLAYGIPRSDLKFFSLLQKAAYTVGGHSFSAATMEFCLLKSKSTAHRPQITLLMALHKNKLSEEHSKFGIHHAEPLINFGLCSGTRSSPMIRVYTPEKVQLQLEDALHDYTRASVGISSKGRLLVPKLLYSYARDFVDDGGVLDWICNLLPSSQVAVVFDCVQQRRHRILGTRNFNIIPSDFTFRYLFPAYFAEKMVL